MSRGDINDPSYATPANDDGKPWGIGGDDSTDNAGKITFGRISSSVINVHASHTQPLSAESLAEQRQSFFFDFLKHSLRQSEWTFRLSVWFMAGGAAIILTAAILGVVHAGNPDLNYLPIVTFLTGVLITAGGGALAFHAQHARAHVTEQANRMDTKIDLDHKLETASTFIDRVDDPEVRNRLNSAAVMKALDMQSSPEVMADRLLPGQERRWVDEIDPGGPAR
ncbi:TRADD-N-associated membrane domain-containing protein [Streptomyces sp. AC154]|uniref:TRADD-N-associated membrane domain-containing protein n=1 Tax=Streptomyces sp. AC154 TaxID=3143184 RepID=UPI003F7D0CC0